MKIHYTEAVLLTKQTTDALNKYLKDSSSSPILFMTSGGSALKLLDFIDITLLSKKITISAVDERYYMNSSINNFAQLTQTGFYSKAKENGCTFIDTRVTQNESQKGLAQRYEGELRKWRNQYPAGKIIAMLGVGPDGHTSGIMPYPENPELFQSLFENEQWIIDYNCGGKNPYSVRITTTNTFLQNEVDTTIVYVSGEEKKEALNKMLADGPRYEIPSRIIKDMREASLYTDIKISSPPGAVPA